MFKPALLVAALLASSSANAQHHGAYAGQQDRAIKSLSDEETKQYLSGAGMGYARAAELNGYPGPMHVLELADKLHLTPEQRAATLQLMEKHKAEARTIGARRVAAEKSVDELFKSGKIDDKRLAEAVRVSSQAESEYRYAHLDTHLKMRALLTEHQVSRYNSLRGYSAGAH